ncbi:MAG: hypothetical protein L0H94_10020, partial [Nitrospira sp.]|nr:hypothetical protein [Nitrospira sp.]
MLPLGSSRDLTLHYRSTTADVRPIIPVEVTLPAFIAVPNTFSVSLSVAGVEQVSNLHWDAHLLPETSDSISRLGIPWDASALPTGRYPYRFTLFNHYGQSSIGTGSNRFTLVRNERASAIGAGWTVASVDRLYPQTDGALVLAKGTGATLTFEQEVRPLVIESYGTGRAVTINGANHSFVAGTGYAGAINALLNPANFGASGVVKRPVQLRSGITTITPALLEGVDLFVITLMDQGQIGDLLPSEVVALEQFVNEGGALLETRSQGTLRPALLGTVASPTVFTCFGNPGTFTADSLLNPVRVGPFGTPSTLTLGCNVPYTVTGPFSILSVSEGGPNLLTLRPHADFGGLGRAVFIGDEDIFISNLTGFGAFYTSNQTLFLNTIAFLAQAPGYKPAPAPPNT